MPLVANPGSQTPQPIVDLQVAFNVQPNATGGPAPVWTSLAHRLVSFRTKSGKRYELDQATAEEGDARCRNTDGALDPTNTSSAYSPNVLPFREARIIVTPPGQSGTTVWNGYVEAYSQSWDKHGAYGWCDLRLVDALTPLSQILLNSCLASEVLLDSPLAYWMLSEPSSATSGGQIAATGEPAMTPVQVGASGTYAFGGTTLTGLPGAGATDGTSGAVTGNTTGLLLTPTSLSVGYYLQATLNPAAGGTFTIECWFSCGTAANSSTIIELSSGPINASIGLDGSGHLSATDTARVLTTTSTVTDGNLHHAVLVVAPGGSTLYLDGTSVATGGTTNSGALNTLTVGGQPSGSPTLFTGTVAHAAVYTTALSASRVTAHKNAGVTAFPEDSGARFGRILNYAPWNGPRNVPAGANNLLGATNLAGKSALAALLAVVDAEQSNMYVSRAGEVTFENRQARYKQLAAVWTFGENSGELPYEDATVDFDPSQVFNSVQVIRPGSIVVNNSDATSARNYFTRSYPTSPLLLPVADDNTAIAAAQYIIGRYKNPQARLAQVRFNPTKNPALWTFALTAKIGDRCRFHRRTSQGAPDVSLDLFIESVGYEWNATTGELIFVVEASPAFWQDYAILTAARGTLAATIAAGVTSFQVTVATDSAGNTPAQNGWTASAMPSIQFADSNAETVAVSAMSVSGQTVTVTCAATTKAHTAGAVVAEASGSATYNQYDVAATLDGNHSLGY